MPGEKPSEWAMQEASDHLSRERDGTHYGDVRDLARALDAAEARGFRRAMESTAIASVHKAVATERAAVVTYLRRPCLDDAHDDRWCPACGPRLEDADIIEASEHHQDTARAGRAHVPPIGPYALGMILDSEEE